MLIFIFTCYISMSVYFVLIIFLFKLLFLILGENTHIMATLMLCSLVTQSYCCANVPRRLPDHVKTTMSKCFYHGCII